MANVKIVKINGTLFILVLQYMIVPYFSCRMGVVVVCKWLYTFVWKKHDHSQGKSLIDCIYHIVLEGRVWLYITCICMV